MRPGRTDILGSGNGRGQGCREQRSPPGYGSEGSNDPDEVDENTLFGVGSLAKVFTAHLAAEMIADGSISPTAPIEGSQQIELRHVLTHRTDLPRDIPASILGSRQSEQLAQLAAVGQVSEKASYSSLGLALAGQTLALTAGGDFADVQRELVFEPAGMTATTYDPLQSDRVAAPHIGSDEGSIRQTTPPLAYPAGGALFDSPGSDPFSPAISCC